MNPEKMQTLRFQRLSVPNFVAFLALVLRHVRHRIATVATLTLVTIAHRNCASVPPRLVAAFALVLGLVVRLGAAVDAVSTHGLLGGQPVKLSLRWYIITKLHLVRQDHGRVE